MQGHHGFGNNLLEEEAPSLQAGLVDRDLLETRDQFAGPPAATSNSSICGQVKFPQWEMTGRVVFTRCLNLSQAGWRP
ncbi:MAG: hypothetical protein ACK4KV_03160, partial [Rhodocyclaceae bacterium]